MSGDARKVVQHRWPFALSPREVALRLDRALNDFDNDMLAAVRNVFIERGLALDAAPAQAEPHAHKSGDILCKQCDYEQSNAAPAAQAEPREPELRHTFVVPFGDQRWCRACGNGREHPLHIAAPAAQDDLAAPAQPPCRFRRGCLHPNRCQRAGYCDSLPVPDAAPAQAEPREPHCPVCGTHEVSMERTCHNSACPEYAKQATVYEGWRESAAPAAQDGPASCKLEPRPVASSQDGRDLDALMEDLRCAGPHSVAHWLRQLCGRSVDAIAALRAERDDAVGMLRVIGEETVLAGLPGGDRNVTLANVRALRARAEQAEAAGKIVADAVRMYAPGDDWCPSLRDALAEYDAAIRARTQGGDRG